MMEMAKENRSECMLRCEAAFIRNTAQMPVGGVEGLRICRETCPVEVAERAMKS